MKNIDFKNTEIAFKRMTNSQLRRTYYIFKILGHGKLVNRVSGMMMALMKLGLPIRPLIKGNVFRHFCGGESMDDCLKTIQELAQSKVGTILDYAIEGKVREEDFDLTTAETVRNIEFAFANPSIPFCVFKPTAIARFELLEKVSRNDMLSASEKEEFARVRERFNRIGESAFKRQVRVFVDAEESWIQDAIDGLTEAMMQKFNKEKAIIYHTLQMYRRDRLSYLTKLHRDAAEKNYFIGVKLVRGAYLEKENARARKLGLQSPIHPTKADSDQAFDDALDFSVTHADKIAVCAGTHNEKSTRLLADLMQNNGIIETDPRFSFAQLLGMSDNLTYVLAHHGYNVSKYVPYGPIHEVVPYLSRRAAENAAVRGQSSRELNYLEIEFQRRKNQKSSIGGEALAK